MKEATKSPKSIDSVDPKAPQPTEKPQSKNAPEHEGATEQQVSDTSAPGPGYDDEPKQG